MDNGYSIYFIRWNATFCEIKRKLQNVTDANITKDLRLLENYGVIYREVYPVVPPKIEYSLTEMGKEFLPILNS